MATGPLSRVIEGIRALTCVPESVSDGQLLRQFIAQRDEAAFEALVHRHGPMVMGVCRRILANFADGQDAFQATFLTLARKAASVVPAEMVGNWLHGVALRTALDARGKLARLRSREKQVNTMPEPMPAPEKRDTGELRELLGQLDREIQRLPHKYRLAVVLCELEGRSRKDVAEHLRLPEGTLSSRLAMARKLLADRLTRRGLMLSAGGLSALLTPSSTQAAVSPDLVSSTAQFATLAAAGAVNGSISTAVAALSDGVIRTMFLAKLKMFACGLAAIGLLSAGLAYVVHASFPAVPQEATKPAVSQKDDGPSPNRDAPAAPKEKSSLASFDKIHLKMGKAVIRQSGKESVAIQGDNIPAGLAKTSVANGVLTLSSPIPNVEFVVECKDLSSLTIEGVATVEARDLKTKSLKVVTSAVGDAVLQGSADEQTIEVKGGAARFDGAALKGKQATVLVSGAGRAVVNVSDKLKVTISVSGQVEYLGNPALEKDVNIAGTLSRRAGEPQKKEAAAEPPMAKGAVKLTAVVDGFTQATQFNPQKYPFKYSGTSVLSADQLTGLAKAGDLPEATSKALLSCLLWPKMGDTLQKAALKSDGKKVTGDVEVLHKYGQQGSHVLKMKLEGTLADGKLTLTVSEPTVSGSWDYGGGSMKLGGKVQITIQAEK